MRVLVTGGSGFIGTELMQQLLSAGHSVINVDMMPSLISGIEEHIIDLTARPFLVDCDFCVHLASGSGGILLNHKQFLVEYNEMINRNVLKMCRHCPTLFMSSINVFEGCCSLDETPHPSSPYAISKLNGEHFFEQLLTEYRQNYFIVRPTNVFGKAQIDKFTQCGESHVIPDLLHKIMNAVDRVEVWGTGLQRRNFLHVRDLCRYVLIMIEDCAGYECMSAAVNVGSSLTMSMSDLACRLLNFSGVAKPIVYNRDYQQYEKIQIENFTSQLWDVGTIKTLEEGLNV